MWTAMTEFLQSQSQNTESKYALLLREFCGFLGIPDNDDGAETLKVIDANDITRYLNWCRSRPARPGRSSLVGSVVSANTIVQKVRRLRSMWQHLVQAGHVDQNPWDYFLEKYRDDKGGDRSPTGMIDFEKAGELLESNFGSSNEALRDKAILASMFGGALRRSEVLELRMLDVRQKGSQVTLQLRNTKVQRCQYQPIPEWAALHVIRYYEIRRVEGARDANPLFTRYIGGRATDKVISDSTLYRLFKRYVSAVGGPDDASCHWARATAITRLRKLGLSHEEIMGFSRHGSVAMVARYDKLLSSDGAEAAEKLSYPSPKSTFQPARE